ncbi:MAG: branched-chain amino acid ABC transporter permease, partial [Chloroflexi bacterium]|nr:branched-chain amino acid ABC transporter permease [Chloroflexota bacterium]
MTKSRLRFLGQSWLFWLVVCIVFLVVQWVLMPRMTEFRRTAWIVFPCIMAIICLGLNLIYGFNGQFSLGQWGFYAIGAYAAALVTYHWAERISYPIEGITLRVPPLLQKLIPMAEIALFHFDAGKSALLLVALLIGAMLAAVISLGFGYVVLLRLGSDYFGIATLGFTIMIQVLIINSDQVIPETKGARGMVGIPQMTSFFWAFIFLVLTLVLVRNIIYSSVGRAIVSVREDEVAAQAMGIDVLKYKTISFVIGSFLAGLAGGLYAHLYAFLSPGYFSFVRSFDPLIIIVFGGLGNMTGTLVATFFWAFSLEGMRIWLPQGFEAWRFVVYPIAL